MPLLIGLLALQGALFLLSVVFPSHALNAVSLVLFCVAVDRLYKDNPQFVVLFLNILFLKSSELASCFIVEYFDAFMRETGRNGFLTGATTRLVFFDLAYLSAAYLSLAGFLQKLIGSEAWYRFRVSAFFSIAFLGVGALFILYLLYVGVVYGFPLITGDERFLFRKTVGGAFDSVLNNRMIVISLVAVVQARGQFRLAAGVICIALIAVVALLGEKFTSVGMMFCQYGTIVLLLRGMNISRKGIAFAGLLTLAVITPTTLITYGALTDFSVAIDAFASRISLNGQAWFLADNAWISNTFSFDEGVLRNEIGALFDLSKRGNEAIGIDFGLYYFMRAFALPQIFTWYFQDGIGFIFTLLPSWVLAYGMMVALALHVGSAIALAVLYRCFFLALVGRHFIFMLLVFKLITWNLNAHVVGYSYLIFGIEVAAIIASFYFVRAIARRRGSTYWAPA